MNPIVESDIAHVDYIMRASVLSCAPKMTLVHYWRRRVMILMKENELEEHDLHRLQGLLHELDTIEKQLRQPTEAADNSRAEF